MRLLSHYHNFQKKIYYFEERIKFEEDAWQSNLFYYFGRAFYEFLV